MIEFPSRRCGRFEDGDALRLERFHAVVGRGLALHGSDIAGGYSEKRALIAKFRARCRDWAGGCRGVRLMDVSFKLPWRGRL